MQQLNYSDARNRLIPRNLAIVLFIRDHGLRPRDIASINMNMLNLSQGIIQLKWEQEVITYNLSEKHVQYIRQYLSDIEKLKRPRYRTKDSLFIAYNNRSEDFQYDYQNEQPKRLSVRGIQEMIKDEVQQAKLRKLSAKHIRNGFILNKLLQGMTNNELLLLLHLNHPLSLYRYKKYLEMHAQNQNKENPKDQGFSQ
ncbi:hypothetical protein P5F74_16640 [Shouchella miscanthi]|uniref:Tyr recombinase domain-containing protein n=2 Tax=Shouchella miscanthi TaxID=2598861 RepID=A0ABU6NRC5_9BACI|nr:hypothetical protein [Shouchella miscanthi]